MDIILDCGVTYQYNIETNYVYDLKDKYKKIGIRLHDNYFNCNIKKCKNKIHWYIEYD